MITNLDFLFGGTLLILGIAQLFDSFKTQKGNSNSKVNYKAIVGNLIIILIGMYLLIRNYLTILLIENLQ